MHKIALSMIETGVMNAMCECRGQRNNGNCGEIVWRRRCICWCEPVCVRPRRRRNRCDCNIEGLSLQLAITGEHELPPECPIVFDEVLNDNSWYLDCNRENGVIEIRKRGIYAIDWDVTANDSPEASCIRFGLEVNGVVESSSTISASGGQVSGRALIQVEQIPTTIRLINYSGCTIQLSQFTPIANLRVFAVE